MKCNYLRFALRFFLPFLAVFLFAAFLFFAAISFTSFRVSLPSRHVVRRKKQGFFSFFHATLFFVCALQKFFLYVFSIHVFQKKNRGKNICQPCEIYFYENVSSVRFTYDKVLAASYFLLRSSHGVNPVR